MPCAQPGQRCWELGWAQQSCQYMLPLSAAQRRLPGCQLTPSPRPVVPERCRWKARAVPRSLVRCSLRSELLCPVQMAQDACPRRGLGDACGEGRLWRKLISLETLAARRLLAYWIGYATIDPLT